MAKSLSQRLSQQNHFYFYVLGPEDTSHITSSSLVFCTLAPNWLSGDENASLVPGLGGLIDSARETAATQNTSTSMWRLAVTGLVFIRPQPTFLSSTLKNVKVPQGEDSVWNGQKYPNRLSSNSLLKILLKVEQCEDFSLNTEFRLLWLLGNWWKTRISCAGNMEQCFVSTSHMPRCESRMFVGALTSWNYTFLH